jgi:hypothetical protein
VGALCRGKRRVTFVTWIVGSDHFGLTIRLKRPQDCGRRSTAMAVGCWRKVPHAKLRIGMNHPQGGGMLVGG